METKQINGKTYGVEKLKATEKELSQVID